MACNCRKASSDRRVRTWRVEVDGVDDGRVFTSLIQARSYARSVNGVVLQS